MASNNEKNWKIVAAMVNVYSDHVVAAIKKVRKESDPKRRGDLVV